MFWEATEKKEALTEDAYIDGTMQETPLILLIPFIRSRKVTLTMTADVSNTKNNRTHI